jgi:predicted metal-dependent hydrolase
MRLSVDQHDATVRLSLPTRAPLGHALLWAQGKREWVESQLNRLPLPQPIVPGMTFMFAGQIVSLEWLATNSRTPSLNEGQLVIGGPIDGLSARLLRWLRREAQQILDAETRALAARYNLSIARVGVGDPRSRWGSCATDGYIRYSWRMILMPDSVRRSIVAHEVAHRVHMNHSAAFHSFYRELMGENAAAAQRWLKANGPALHWFGRDGY